MSAILSNPWVVLILGVWAICGAVAIVNKDGETMGVALMATFIIGFGWLLAAAAKAH